MPYALEKKYPNAKFETKWQFLLPMKNVAKDPRGEVIRRHHIHEKTFVVAEMNKGRVVSPLDI